MAVVERGRGVKTVKCNAAAEVMISSDEASVISALKELLVDPAEWSPGDEHHGQQVLTKFCQIYHNQRCFSQHTHSHTFKQLLCYLKKHCLTEAWLLGMAKEDGAHMGHAHTALMSMRLLLRDEQFQHQLMTGSDPLPVLVRSLSHHIQLHFSSSLPSHQSANIHHNTHLLKELTNIFQKLSNTVDYRQRLVDSGVHKLLVQLLESHDLVPLQCSLCALINLSKTSSVSACVGSLPCAPPLLHIISSYDTVSRHLASDLLLLLSQHSQLQDQIRDSDGLPQCLRILHCQDLHLLHRVVGVVERLLDSSQSQEEIRLLGGIPLLLSLLSRQRGGAEEEEEKEIALKAVCCSALTQLVLNDANAQLLIQGNGLYLIASQLLPLAGAGAGGDGGSTEFHLRENLQRYALRALRYLYSVERNRKVFKNLFPPNLFESFIDIGHYTRDLSAYSPLAHTLNTLPESERAVLQANIDATNQNKAPIFTLGGYAVLELLGSGAFGSVYKVRKQNSKVLLALKEIRCTHPSLGHTLQERTLSMGRLLNEVNMIKENLHHPNVVRYHKCFQEGDHLYIVMELLEGAPLCDVVSSLTERGSRFSEACLWKLFVQLVLGLRYLHKEKRIVHRDLSPANLMISQEDKLTITDFGLAKQKRDVSVLKSVVGTVLYWCPELVQNEPYTEKADVWAAGCILYLMATLRPPFHSTNLLSLAKKIAEVDYEGVPEGVYSSLVSDVVSKCLTADPQLRPDIVEVGGMLSEVLMQQMDTLSLSNESLEKRLAKEKQKTIRHYQKAVTSERRYQQLLSSSSLPASTAASSSAPALSTPLTTPLHARRQLSSAFEAVDSPAGTDHKRTASPSRARVHSGGDLDHHGNHDPLQSSTDSVFHDSPVQERWLLGNSEQPASPQVVTKLNTQVNPLLPHTNMQRHAHFVATSLKDTPPVPSPPHQTRKMSLPTRTAPRLQDWGPLSPLAKTRTPSASSTLSISPKHLREISDPILSLLTQLHKLVYVTQLAPPLSPSPQRTLLQRYKRALFASGTTPTTLKTHLHRLVSGSADAVGEELEGEGLVGGVRLVQGALQEMREETRNGGLSQDPESSGTLTYEILQQMIETVATQHQYYTSQQQKTTPPGHAHHQPSGHTHQSSA